MSILDEVLKGIGGAPDDVVNLAEKVGISPAMAVQAAMSSLSCGNGFVLLI